MGIEGGFKWPLGVLNSVLLLYNLKFCGKRVCVNRVPLYILFRSDYSLAIESMVWRSSDHRHTQHAQIHSPASIFGD